MYSTDLQQISRDFSELPRSRDELLLALPRFVERNFDAISIISGIKDGQLGIVASSDSRLLRRGDIPPAAEEVMAAVRDGKRILSTESTDLPDSSHVIACVLLERVSPIAVLQLHRQRAFSESTVTLLEVFGRLLSARLSDTYSKREAMLMAELVTSLLSVVTIEEGAQLALDVLARHTGAEAGVILQTRHSVMNVIASYGAGPERSRAEHLGIGQEYPNGLAWQACIEGRTLSMALDSGTVQPGTTAFTAVQPLGWRDAYRYVLVLRMPERLTLTPGDQALFESMSTQLHLALDRLQRDVVQEQLLGLQVEVVDADAGGMYQKILNKAVELVPGAMSGSLLIRSSPHEPFSFRATVGYDLGELRKVQLSEPNMLRWYGRGLESFSAGEPRSLRSSSTDISNVSRLAASAEDPIVGLEGMKSTVCLPVTFRGDVLAFINLDNHLDDNAFAEDSFRVLRHFGPVVAHMLAAARQRDQIISMAHSDSLTGLPNRRGADVALARQLLHAEQHDETFVLLVLDLNRFKDINDRYGHDEGDQALIKVARALSASARADDTIARWGGDEFSVLLPATTRETGEQVAQRLRQTVAELGVGDVRLGVDIGVAHYPEDGTTATRLLQVADNRMYTGKLDGRTRRRDD